MPANWRNRTGFGILRLAPALDFAGGCRLIARSESASARLPARPRPLCHWPLPQYELKSGRGAEPARASGRTARRLKAGIATLLLLTFAAVLAPQDAQAALTLTATAGDGQVTLSWSTDISISVSSFNPYTYNLKHAGERYLFTSRSISGFGGQKSGTFTVTSLDNGAEYSFMIRAVNASGDGAATDWVTATPAAPAVAAPVLTAATSTTSTRIDLTWTHAGTSAGDFVNGAARFGSWELSYRLKGAGSWTNFNGFSNPGINVRKVVARIGDAFPGGASVEVRIRARAFTTDTNSATVNGPWSNIRTVTFKNDDTAALTITGAPVTVEAGASASYTVALTQAYAGTLSITSSATAKATVDPATLTFSTTNYSTAQMVTVTGVEAGTAKINHAFRLTGATADAIPDAGAVAVTVNAASSAPAKPAGFTVTGGNQQAMLSWTDPNDASIIRWQYSQDGAWKDVPSSSATTAAHTVTGLSTGTAYAFRVRAVNNNGAGTASDEKTVTLVWTSIPTKPSGFKATAGVGRVTLTWDAQPGQNITRWGFQRKASGAAWGATTSFFTGTGATTTYAVTGLTPGTAYDFRIRAVQVANNGPWSDTVTATPFAAATPRVVVTPTELTINEGGGNQYTVALAGVKPTGIVTISVTSVAPGRDDQFKRNVTIEPYYWNEPQSVTTYIPINDSRGGYEFTHRLEVSAPGANYADVEADDVTITVVDTTATLATDPAAVTEGADISLSITSDRALVGAIPVKLTFADRASSGFAAADLPGGLVQTLMADFGSTGGTTGTVTIPTNNDSATSEGAETYTVTLGDDSAYNGYKLGADVTADGTLNDAASGTPTTPGTTKGVTVVPTTLTAAEGGGAGFLVVLDAAPSANVTITVSGDSGDVTFTTQGQVAPTTLNPTGNWGRLTFTTANWNVPQWVRVFVREDADMEDDTDVTLTLTASGGGYDMVTIDSVTITVAEDDKTMSPGGAEGNRLPPGSAGPPAAPVRCSRARPYDLPALRRRGASGDCWRAAASPTPAGRTHSAAFSGSGAAARRRASTVARAKWVWTAR